MLALLATASALLSSTTEALRTRQLQSQPYQYTSGHVKARASAISKDFQTVTSFLAQDNGAGRQNARAVYQLGAFCQSFATLKLKNTIQDSITQGTSVTGTSGYGDTINGIVHRDAFPGDATLEVMYLIPDDGGIGAICSVAGNPSPQYDLCFTTDGSVTVSGGLTLEYSGYDSDANTANGLSLQSMSTTISGAGTQGYPRIGTFASYYGTNKYADEFIRAAFDRQDTAFDDGNAEFSKFTQFGTNKFIEVATLTMSSWMHIVIKMQDAVELCKSLPEGQRAVSEVPLWDNAVAVYRGLGGAAGGTMGQLYHLANQYCAKFGTCADGPNGTTGMAKANQKAYTHFNSGKQDLLDGKCALAEAALDEVAVAMIIPVVQGLLFHAYELDVYKEQREVVQGEAAAFLHSLLPLVSACSLGNGVMIYNQIKVGSGKTASFEAIKSSVEGQYDCLGITCEDVGGIVDLSDPSKYQRNAAPCGTINLGDQDNDGVPDIPAPMPVTAPTSPVPPPVPAPVRSPWPTQDDSPTSTPTDPPSSQYQKIEYVQEDDSITYVLAIGLPVLSVIAIFIVVVNSYKKKKEHGKEFDSGVGDVTPNEEDPTMDDVPVENLQGEFS